MEADPTPDRNGEGPTDFSSVCRAAEGCTDLAVTSNRAPDLSTAPEAERRAAIEQLLTILGQAMAGIEGYCVFASTALYVAPTRDHQLPGDFDLAIDDDRTRQRIQERWDNLPDVHPNIIKAVHFENSGRPRQLRHQSTAHLPGYFLLRSPGSSQTYRYNFEWFVHSPGIDDAVVRPNAKQQLTVSHGLRMLNSRGLQKQYERVQHVEAIDPAVITDVIDRVMNTLESNPQYLHATRHGLIDFQKNSTRVPDLLKPVLESLALDSPVRLAQLICAIDDHRKAPNAETQQVAYDRIVQLLQVFKNKTADRLQKLQTLRQLNRVEVTPDLSNSSSAHWHT